MIQDLINYQGIASTDETIFKNDGQSIRIVYSGKRTNRQFRDTSGWYHIMMALKTQASKHTKIYVNGEQETSFAYNSGDYRIVKIYLIILVVQM